ncbi:dihydrolipoyl dehydrogenase [Pasteuria penetrans]|uniref:dihydrolipoyl dehydrogenase n=1 Tax=Pasteuria penetrans TaxID=86005 RepID=UPI000FB555B2|nr:dihydrolipoyl dehydrogenase [Pasteuria penetrans]
MVVGDFAQDVDVCVIGAGPGGYVAAIRAAQLGRKVILVERDQLGGVCLNRGCIPSKALISAADRYDSFRGAAQLGFRLPEKIDIDWDRLMAWKRGVIQQLRVGITKLLSANEIEVVFGEARFIGPSSVRVVTKEAGQTYNFKQAIVATGSRPYRLPGLPMDGGRILSSTEALELPSLPERMLIVGGGYIGLELGTAYAKLGTQVTILEGSGSLLPGVEPRLVQIVQNRFRRIGGEIVTHARVQQGQSTSTAVHVMAVVDGKAQQYTADYCLVAVGRVPNTEDLGLAVAGVHCDDKGFIRTSSSCCTSRSTIYAIGDCAGGDLLAHKASFEARVAAEAACGRFSVVDVQAMPYVIFSDPEIAYAGFTVEAARKAGYDPVVGRCAFQANGRALSLQQGEGFIQVVVDSETEQIVGVQMVGHEASSLLATAVLAIETGVSAEDIGLIVHAHPTLSEAFAEAAENAVGRSIHGVNRKRG